VGVSNHQFPFSYDWSSWFIQCASFFSKSRNVVRCRFFARGL